MSERPQTDKEHSGYFWLPDKPEKEIAGVLRLDQSSNIELDLLGSFWNIQQFGGEHHDVDIIHGVMDRKLVTLCHCTQTQMSLSSPGFNQTSFRIRHYFEGHLFDRLDDIRFDKFYLEYEGLEEWLSLEGFKETGARAFGVDSDSYSLRYENVPAIVFVFDGYEFTFALYPTFSREMFHSRSIEQSAAIEIATASPISFASFRNEILKNFNSFFLLAMQKTILPKNVEASSPWTQEKHTFLGRDFGSFENRVRFVFPRREQPDKTKTIASKHFLFNRSDLGNSLGDCIFEWTSKSDVLEPVYDLYVGHVYNSELPSHYSLLNLTQALESIHRRMSNMLLFPQHEFEKMRDNVITNLPNNISREFKIVVQKSLEYANELNLRKRLKALLKDTAPISSYCIPNVGKFVNRVVEYRNYFTHYDARKRPPQKYTEVLFRTVQQLKFLLEVCFLFQMNMNPTQIDILVKRNERYSFLRSMIIKLSL